MTDRPLKNLESYFRLGWYHLVVILLFQTCIVGNLSNMVFMMFGGAKPRFHCPLISAQAVPESPELCALFKNGSCTPENVSYSFYSINIEWGLICDKSNWVYLATSVQMFGVLIGAPLFGQLSDMFGRKWVLCSAWASVVAVGVGSAFSPNWTAFTVFRFFIGLFMGGIMSVWYVFSSEIIPHRHRVWIFAASGWPPAYIIFAWIAYFSHTWRTFSWVVNVITVPALLILAVFLFESPRWLLHRGKVTQAAEIITKINSWNCRNIDQEHLLLILRQTVSSEHQRKTKKHSFWHLFYTWRLTRYSLTMAFLWFTTSWVSYGLLFNTGNLTGSIYLNVTYYGIMRWVICLLISLLDVTVKAFGRKLAHCISVGSMIVSATVIFVFMLAGWDQTYVSFIRYLNLFAVVWVSPVWLIIYLLTAELYPTPIRNLANSFSSLLARVGGILAPQVIYLSEFWPPALYVIFAIFLTVDFLAYLLLLPETKGKPLPERMPEKSEKITRKISFKRLSVAKNDEPTENNSSL